MKHHHKSAAKIKRAEPLPLPPSLEEAFAEIENEAIVCQPGQERVEVEIERDGN